jgi:hypothetical protein
VMGTGATDTAVAPAPARRPAPARSWTPAPAPNDPEADALVVAGSGGIDAPMARERSWVPPPPSPTCGNQRSYESFEVPGDRTRTAADR